MESPELTERMDAALASGSAVLDDVLRELAREVVREGKVQADRLDAHQSTAFRLAHLHAQSYAAREMIRYAALGEAEALLAGAFGGRTLITLRQQLPLLVLHLNGMGDGYRSFMESAPVDSLMARTTSAAFHHALLERLETANTQGADGLDEDHRLLKSTFRTFADRRVAPQAEAWHREDRLIPDALIQEAAELGCFGLSIPAAHGGAQDQPDNLGMVVVTEELSRGALIFGSLITRPEILAKALLKGGTQAQQSRYLPSMASGERMVAVAITEPDFGSDVANLQTAAQPVEGGWRINGTKIWSTFAGRAELLGLLARTEPDRTLGHRGLSMFVIEKPVYTGHAFEHRSAGGGRLTGRAIATLGYRGMHSFELNFEDYFVPAANLIGENAGRGRGFYLQMEAFAFGRLQTAGRALGVMQAAWEQARAYSRERAVFGKPLGAFPLTREKLVRMAATVQASRQATYAAARRLNLDEGQMEASLVKLFTGHNAEWITREAQQLHGGMGYAEEYAVSRLFVDARVLSIFEGAEEVLALRVIVPALLQRTL